MRGPIRKPIEVIQAISLAASAYPDQRVMQVIVNACGNDPFYVEDEDAIKKLREYATRQR